MFTEALPSHYRLLKITSIIDRQTDIDSRSSQRASAVFYLTFNVLLQHFSICLCFLKLHCPTVWSTIVADIKQILIFGVTI